MTRIGRQSNCFVSLHSPTTTQPSKLWALRRAAEHDIMRWKDETAQASSNADYYGQKLGVAEAEIERFAVVRT